MGVMMTPGSNFCAAVVDNRALVMDEMKVDVEYLAKTEAYCQSISFRSTQKISRQVVYFHIFLSKPS